jgi:hypothetical protein
MNSLLINLFYEMFVKPATVATFTASYAEKKQ